MTQSPSIPEFQPTATRNSGELFGHPKGLYVLFFTEMWERFSFYGMRALLILYLLNHFFWSQEDASALFGWYVFLAYALPVLGGIVADKWLGARRAVVVGALLLSAGHGLMAVEKTVFFYSALALIVAGVGFLKPNISTQVGALYKPGDPRRDGAFTIFYMGINLGAFFGPLLCDWLRIKYGYSWGFGAAGVGMILGLIVYVIGQRKLVEFNQEAAPDEGDAAAVVEHPPHVVRDRIIVLLVVFAFVILFWTAFEQAANVMLVWADKHTNLCPLSSEPPAIDLDGTMVAGPSSGQDAFSFGSGQTQSINPLFIILLGGPFAFMWSWLQKRGLQPSTPAKMVLGLAGVAGAFLIMVPAANFENRPSSTALHSLPAGVDLSKYGASRLSYDAVALELRMTGVLPDLDRYRMLAAAAPADLKAALDELAAESGEGKTVTKVLATAPAQFRVVGVEAEKMLTWDAATKTLTATDEVNQRAKVEILSLVADSDFKAAVDDIYVQSSKFRISIWWLVLHYLLATMGELCLSPVGLSLVTKLAPAKSVGTFMGGWFLATAVSEKVAHIFGGMWGTMTPEKYFWIFVIICGVGAVLLAVLVRPLKRMMHGVH